MSVIVAAHHSGKGLEVIFKQMCGIHLPRSGQILLEVSLCNAQRNYIDLG